MQLHLAFPAGIVGRRPGLEKAVALVVQESVLENGTGRFLPNPFAFSRMPLEQLIGEMNKPQNAGWHVDKMPTNRFDFDCLML
jgi:hypothetical protein